LVLWALAALCCHLLSISNFFMATAVCLTLSVCVTDLRARARRDARTTNAHRS
jgi:hypothetical protein